MSLWWPRAERANAVKHWESWQSYLFPVSLFSVSDVEVPLSHSISSRTSNLMADSYSFCMSWRSPDSLCLCPSPPSFYLSCYIRPRFCNSAHFSWVCCLHHTHIFCLAGVVMVLLDSSWDINSYAKWMEKRRCSRGNMREQETNSNVVEQINVYCMG